MTAAGEGMEREAIEAGMVAILDAVLELSEMTTALTAAVSAMTTTVEAIRAAALRGEHS